MSPKNNMKSSQQKDSNKTDNHRIEFERLKSDIKAKKINTIVDLKLNKITRNIYDRENLMMFLAENNAYLDCVYLHYP